MIATAAIPAGQSRIRAQLQHAMRYYGSGIGMSMPACANHGIHVLGEVFLGYDVKGEKEEKG